MTDDDMVEYTAMEEEIRINPLFTEMAVKGGVFGLTPLCPGCGPQLGLKIALQITGNCIMVTSSGCMSLAMKAMPISCFNGGMNAISAAASIARSREERVLCYIGDGALASNLGALHAAAERNDNLLCICYNNQGYCNMNKPFKKVKEFARVVKAGYVATASVSHLEDYIDKLKAASSLSGFRFIDLMSPCPVTMGFDPSNTMEIGRLAVETGIWPLYKIENGDLTVTEKLRKLEPVDRYLELQKNALSDEEKNELQKTINKRWKMLHEGCI